MCKDVGTGEILALKVLKKKDIIKDDDCGQALTENNVLQKLKHPFLTVGHAVCNKATVTWNWKIVEKQRIFFVDN